MKHCLDQLMIAVNMLPGLNMDSMCTISHAVQIHHVLKLDCCMHATHIQYGFAIHLLIFHA